MMKYLIIHIITISILLSCNNTKSDESNNTMPQAEIFATTQHSVGNISFTSTGDLVYSLHPFFNPSIRVMIMDAKTKQEKPFPNLEWNTPRDTDENYLSSVLGVRNDENGVVWLLDMGQRTPITPKLVGWNTKTNMLERVYKIPPPATNRFSQPNDMVIDTKHNVIIIADEGIGNGGDGSTAAFIIVDMQTGRSRRILEGTRTTLPENIPIIVKDIRISVDGKDLLVGNDGITADKDFEWVYYGPLNGNKIYRIKTTDLINENLTDAQLDTKIETYSAKPNNGGLSIDKDGNIYLTALEKNSVEVVMANDKKVTTAVSHEKMQWPDGVSYNDIDGYMYVSASQVHLGAIFNNGVNKASAPFYIFRFKPLADGVPYR